MGLGGCILMLVFLKLSGAVMDGETMAFDKRIVEAFRKTGDPSRPIGPAWLASAMMDIPALGGPTVIFMVVLAVICWLVAQHYEVRAGIKAERKKSG